MEDKAIIKFSDFIDLYNENLHNLKEHRKGQHLMLLLCKIWPDEYKRISSIDYYDRTDIDCYYNDELIDNTINHLQSVWQF